MSESPFWSNFDISFSLFCRKSVQSWMRRFWAKNAEETTYGAYDGPSCLWRSVGGSVEKQLKEDGEVWQVWGYEDYDGPSCRFVVKIREVIPVPRFQELKYFETRQSTDRSAYDGPSHLPSRGMKKAAEELHQVWDDGVHNGPSWPRRSVAWSVDPAAFWQISSN